MTALADNYFISTSAKVLLNDWFCLHELIADNSALIKESEPSQAAISHHIPALLSDRQLNDALLGPLQIFFKSKMTAYATIGKIRLILTAKDNDTFKNDQLTKQLPPAKLDKLSTSELDTMQSELDELSKAHYQQWQELLTKWVQQINLVLTVNAVTLSDIETKELSDREPWSELHDRFTDLQVEVPQFKTMSIKTFLYLKAYLCIHSVLSREMQTHDATAIKKMLDKLSSTFNDISKEEKELNETQIAATKQATASLPTLVQNKALSSVIDQAYA